MNLSNQQIKLLLYSLSGVVCSIPLFLVVAIFGVSTPNASLVSGFVSGPDGRGTLGIVWSCLTTIFTCIYVSVHLDVPKKQEQGLKGRKKVWDWITRSDFYRKMFWVIIGFFAPEAVLAIAVGEFTSAQETVRRMGSLNTAEMEDWDLTHAFCLSMGGFKCSYIDKMESSGEFLLCWYNATLEGKCFDFKSILHDIEDRSKADPLVKLVVCLQAGWLVIQTVIRVNQSLPVTPLEVATCAYVICALATYFFWWNKPYGVKERINIESYSVVSARASLWPEENILSLLYEGSNRIYKDPHQSVINFLRRPLDPSNLPRVIQEPSFPFMMTGIIFGAIHCAAWNATFPNNLAQFLWRASSILLISLPVVAYIFYSVGDVDLLEDSSSWWRSITEKQIVSLSDPLKMAERCENIIRRLEEELQNGEAATFDRNAVRIDILEVWGPEVENERKKIKRFGVFMCISLLLYCMARFVLVLLVAYSFSGVEAGVYDDIDFSRFFPHWH